ncbi:Aminotransferase class I and II [Novosphingobium sp. CF614]|uniref:aminotransferase class I/II-fold pyridoxal phosphate-dependent enzyme n=1 Tax=Novosphingobium sp. CF614 TaxID=1884364 RepID=UPI0008E663F5|nr:aminotransferase class I/II-fold pyridoxal phosphate-dependent enzyme [Novosphingobium sp. CF614]SFG37557.1 Aminotransferase class I and II [Novosphingobium sp. CF614]
MRLSVEGCRNEREALAGRRGNDKLPDATVLLRNGYATVAHKGKRIRLGRNPSFSGRTPELWREKRTRPQFDFFVGRPHPKSFPTSFWQRAVARHLAYARGVQTEYGDPRGLPALREAVAAHLRETRGIDAGADQILITSGIQGALNLLARIFLQGSAKASVAVENPCPSL